MSADNQNPYAPPAAMVDDTEQGAGEGSLIPGGRSVPAGNAWNWVTSAWEMFKAQPGTWILMFLVYVAIIIVMSIIPLVNFLVSFLMPVFMGGIILACARQHSSGDLQIGDLFGGFSQKFGQLLLVGLIAFGCVFAIIFVGALVFGVGAAISGMASGSFGPEMLGGMIVFFGAIFILMMVAYAAIWFAPALILQHDVAPVEAMKMSLQASFRNILPYLVFVLIYFILAILASIPLLLGWFVLAPVLMITFYTSYRDIFIED